MKAIKLLVEEFSKALSLAIYDRELELHGKKLTYYYDTDVVFPQIMGFEAERYESRTECVARLVRALLSCGYLGEFYMLRPHALELNEKLKRQRRVIDHRSQAVVLGKAREFLRSKGIWKIMSKLCDIAEGKKDYEYYEDEARVRSFIKTLQDSAGETFAYIEQINGTWWQRLKRYYDDHLICFDKMGPEIYDLLDTHEKEIREFNQILRKKRQDLTMNVFQDAVALAILHKIIRERDRGEIDDIIRFYTETSSIKQEVDENQELRSLLSYQRPLVDGLEAPPGAELVLRNPSYFIMRIWFSELAPKTYGASSGTLKSLKELSKELEDLIESKELESEKVLAGIKHRGMELSKLIENFEKLTIMDSIWVGGRVPRSLRDLKALAKWTEVFKFAEKQETENILFEQIDDTRHKLELKVSIMQRWKRDFELVLRASEKTRIKTKGRIEEPMRDLGLVRWGYSLNQKETQTLSEILKALLQEEEIDLTLEASKVATIMEEARHNPRQCMVVCGVLWALRLFRNIVQLVKDCITNNENEQLPPSLLVIQASAEIRTGEFTTQGRQEIVNRVWDLQKSLPENQRVDVLLGIGYVIYHAWKQEGIDSDIVAPGSNKMTEEFKGWAEKCFALGEEAIKRIPKDELAWAFAINHCAYVGIVTEVEPDRTESYFKVLLKLDGSPKVWNFRFDDTIGTYYLLKAERLWERSSPGKRKILDLSGMLAKAEEYFKKTKERDIGDIDIDEHMNRLSLLAGEAQSVEKETQ
jgi:hypothetical protein